MTAGHALLRGLMTGSFAKLPIGEPLDGMAARTRPSIGLFLTPRDFHHSGYGFIFSAISRNYLRFYVQNIWRTIASSVRHHDERFCRSVKITCEVNTNIIIVSD